MHFCQGPMINSFAWRVHKCGCPFSTCSFFYRLRIFWFHLLKFYNELYIFKMVHKEQQYLLTIVILMIHNKDHSRKFRSRVGRQLFSTT